MTVESCFKKKKGVVEAVKKIWGLSHSFGQVVTGAELVPVTFLFLFPSIFVQKGDIDLESTRRRDTISNEAIKCVIYVSN